jgi:tubulin polyglutamylase TTLL6/13
MHLTNYSVNKYSRAFSNDDEVGSKRRFSTLNRILSSEGYDIAELWSNIDDVIVKTIISAWPMLKHTYNASFPTHDIIQACFEILGFDIIIDHKMKPFLLEVNHSPSFHTDEQIDKEVKEALIKDTFTILNLNSDVKKRVLEEDKRRIQCRLLQRLREYPRYSNKDNFEYRNSENSDLSSDDCTGPWAAQIHWEETHLGGYRRIMPAPGDPERYSAFFLVQSQASVYNETAASKRREECAKQQRIELEEKFRLNQAILHKGRLPVSKMVSGEDSLVTNNGAILSSNLVVKKRGKLKKDKRDCFSPEMIADYEERERIALLAQRDFLIRTCGLVQNVNQKLILWAIPLIT